MFQKVITPPRSSSFNQAIYSEYQGKRGDAFRGWKVNEAKTVDERKQWEKEAIGLARQLTTEEIFNKLQYVKGDVKGEKYSHEIAYGSPAGENKVIFAVAVKNANRQYEVLGTFIVDFDFLESNWWDPDSDYTQNEFSNSVVLSFVTSLFLRRDLKKITDDDLAFAREEELLQTALREAKQQNRSKEEKALLVDITKLLKYRLEDYRERYPEKTKIFISVLEILNKLVKNGALSQKDRDQLIQLSDEVIDEGSPQMLFWGRFLTAAGAVLLGIGITLFILAILTPAGAPIGMAIGAALLIAFGIVPGLGLGGMLWRLGKEEKLLKDDLPAIAHKVVISDKDEELNLGRKNEPIVTDKPDPTRVTSNIFSAGDEGDENKFGESLLKEENQDSKKVIK